VNDDIDQQLQKTLNARTAALGSAVTLGIVALIVGMATDNAAAFSFILLLGFGLLIGWASPLDDQVTKLRAAKEAGDPAPPAHGAAEPTVVGAVIGLVGTVVAAVIALSV
jgi:hypothetical protein